MTTLHMNTSQFVPQSNYLIIQVMESILVPIAINMIIRNIHI